MGVVWIVVLVLDWTVGLETTEVVIVGGGIAGMSTAYGLRRLGVHSLVLERGKLCQQGATVAARQGHVYAPDGLLDPLRSESVEIYRRLDAEFGVGLEQNGAATLSEDARESELYALSNSIASHPAQGTRFVASLDGIESTSGLALDQGSASVQPCLALAAMRQKTTVWENVNVDGIARDRGEWLIEVTGTELVRAKILVLALGVWRNAFVRRHFPGLLNSDIGAVGGQIAIYRLDDSTNVSGVSLFFYGKGSLTKKLDGASYFLTHDANGTHLSDYVYAKARGHVLAVGTRRQPVADPDQCDALPFDHFLQASADRRVFKALRVQSPTMLLRNYTACFPVVLPHGELRASQLAPGLYELNGLAGGGIARAPAAGARLADLIYAELQGRTRVRSATECAIAKQEYDPQATKILADLLTRAAALRSELRLSAS